MLIVKQRMILGGQVRLEGFEVPADLADECRHYPAECWADTEPECDAKPEPKGRGKSHAEEAK
jgi:hypothetical protein